MTKANVALAQSTRTYVKLTFGVMVAAIVGVFVQGAALVMQARARHPTINVSAIPSPAPNVTVQAPPTPAAPNVTIYVGGKKARAENK